MAEEAKLGQASSLKTLIMILHRIVLKICEFLQALRMDNLELGNNLGKATPSIFLMLVKARCARHRRVSEHFLINLKLGPLFR